MGKRLAPVIAMLAMLAPVAAYALGLGNITMKSALNQPLEAEIGLLSVQKGDLENLQIRLGSPEDFARVGVDRAYFLTKMKFDLAQKPDGTPYIKVSSTELVTEPFLNFVVEARWPRGRILREFTVLVDPPVVSEEAPAPIQQAAVQAAPAAAPRSTRPAPIPERATLSPVMSRDGVLSYGPVRPNDTLWVIANRMRPDDSVTVNQMMLALVRDNPQAFYNGNVNQLKAGYVLRIEDPASITAVPAARADAEIERQRAEWEARKSGRPLRQVAAAETAADSGKVGAGAGGSTAQARLKLVAPGSEGSGSGTGDADVDRLRQDLVLAAEALDANRQETEELKSRLAQMEEQLAAMQRLIMLKDDEMLALQKQLAGEVEAPAAGGETVLAEQAPAEDVLAEEPLPEEAAAAASEEAETPAAAAEAETAAEASEPPAPAPVAEAPASEPGLLENPLLMYGGIGVLVLAIVGWIVARRRKMQEGFQESILNVGGAGTGAAAGAATSSELAQGAGGESSMVSDFAMSEISDMSGIQTDASEVDPISEADVYLAYGRHQQAEDIIRAALENAPERNDLKLKLLEVFFAAKNGEAFEAQAQELHDALGDESDPLWAKAVTMGSQLCPGNPLFGSAEQAPQEALEDVVADADDDLLDFDFDLDSPDLGESKPKTGDEGLGDELKPGEEAEAVAPAASDNGLDFDVSSLDFDLDQRSGEIDDALAASGGEGAAAKDGEALDFDMEMLDEDAARAKAEATDETPPEPPQRAGEEESADTVLDDLDLDLAESVKGIEDTVLEFDSDATAAADRDEAETPVAEAADTTLSDAEQEADAALAEMTLGDVEQTESEQADFSIDLSEEALALDEREPIEFDIQDDEKAAGEFDLELGEEVAESEALIVEEADADSTEGTESTASGEAGEEPKKDKDGLEAFEEELAVGEGLDDDLLDEDIFGEVDEIGTKLDLAKAYVDMGDGDGARSILDEVLEEGDDTQKQQAKELLEQIG